MRPTLLLVILSFAVNAQTSALFRLGDAINLIAPATNQDGNMIAFAAAVSPDGSARKGTDLYLFDRNTIRRLTNYAGDSNITGVTSVTYTAGFAGYTAIPSSPTGIEEVHLIDGAGTTDRTVATDKEGCIQPLCVNCFRACVGPVHLNADASKVLYAVARQNPFWVVNADGAGRKQLPVYTGALAISPQRVISRDGQVVFTSSAPFGPTFAPAATDVSIVNLDGTGLRQVTRFGNANFFASNATISTDASLIAFESNYSESGAQQLVNQIWVVKPDGTGLRRLSSGPEAASSPSISADGSAVVFLQAGQIKRANSGDGKVITLTKLSLSAPQYPVLTDAGTQVVFTLGPQAGSPAAIYRIPSDSLSDMRVFDRIYVPRFVNPNGVASAAGYGAPSPGSLISVYGANLGVDELAQATTFPLPLSLHGVSLAVNGKSVPLIAATPWQINAQLPQTIIAGTAAFQVNSLAPVSAEIKNTAPAILAFPFTQGRLYYSQAAAFHAGTGIPADMDHPAAAGEVLEIYGMGLGLTDPMAEAGMPSPASPPARALRMPRVQIGNRDATVVFAGLTPGLAGVYQVNATVPSGLAPGLHTVSWAGPDGAVISASIAVK